MTLYGHDSLTGHLFAWDKEFRYVGRVASPPDISFSVQNSREHRLSAFWAGAFFLSGNRSPAWVFYASDEEEVVAIIIVDENGMMGVQQKKIDVSMIDRIVL